MRGKLFGFAVALLSVATIGIVQLSTSAAEPGKVGSAPLCTVTAVGARDSAFKINGANTLATVQYKVTGAKDCKARVSANSFNAPSMNGLPYDKQVLFKRVTKIVTPGTYKTSVALPTNGAKGCFYQVDLTYGTNNITPVIAYGHGKVNGCLPKPVAKCDTLSKQKISRDTYKFTASATAKDGAKINGFVFTVKNGSKTVKTKQVSANAKNKATFTYTMPKAGDYTVKATALTSEGKKNSQSCVKSISLKPLDTPTPGVSIEKLVEGADYYATQTDTEYDYQIKVTNTGETTLKNVAVTDTPEAGVTLLSADKGTISSNTWTYTIPELAVGADMSFTLSATVPEYLAGRIDNTACVDATEVPGSPDDCDNAEVEVEEPGKTIVCDPETGDTISVADEDADKYVPVGSEECEDTPETPETPSEPSKDKTPEALPYTGPADVAMQVIGAMSLAGASSYYISSRRQS